MNKSPLIYGAIAIANLTVGVAVGYKIASVRLADRFEKRLATETEDMREFYTMTRQKYPNPQAAAADLLPATLLTVEEKEAANVAYHKIVKSEEYKSDEDPEEELAIEAEAPDVVNRNVFEEKVDPSKPYIISQENYMQNEDGFQQGTLTYYEKDSVLTDERETVIEDIDDVIGKDNLKFGSESSDENIVHIKNEKLSMDFEVVRSEGSYAIEVLGLDEVPPQPRKSRRQLQRDE